MGMMGLTSAAPRIGKVAPGTKRKTGLLATATKKKAVVKKPRWFPRAKAVTP